MPEYLALIHHHAEANAGEDELEPPSVEDVEGMLMRAMTSSAGSVH